MEWRARGETQEGKEKRKGSGGKVRTWHKVGM